MELRNICLLLEHEASKNAGDDAKSEILKTLLSEVDDVSRLSDWVDHFDLSVQDVIHHAWIQDQISSSLIENDTLDGVSEQPSFSPS